MRRLKTAAALAVLTALCASAARTLSQSPALHACAARAGFLLPAATLTEAFEVLSRAVERSLRTLRLEAETSLTPPIGRGAIEAWAIRGPPAV